MKCKVMRVAERAGSTADVAGPRPREVGGACRIQVLAVARTQETVGGPNGAKRSEFRRRCPPVGVTQLKRKALKAGNAHGTPQTTGANSAFLPPSPFILNFTGANRGFLPPSLKPRVQMRVFCPRRVQKTPESPLQRSGAFMSKDKLQKPRLPAGGFADFEAGF